jgi:hypothetical protein
MKTLSFITKQEDKLGFSFYPNVTGLGYLEGEEKGAELAQEVIAFYCEHGFDTNVLSKMIVSLSGIDPINDTLTPEQEETIGHITGIMSVAHKYIARGVKRENN